MRNVTFSALVVMTACASSTAVDGNSSAGTSGAAGAGAARTAGFTGSGGALGAGATSSGAAPSGGTASGGSPSGGNGAGGGSGGAGGSVVHSCDSLPAVGTWENISPPPLSANGGVPTIPTVILDPKDPATVIIGAGRSHCCDNGSAGLWKSTDCGATWAKLNTGRNGSVLDTGWAWEIAMDPTDPRIIYTANGYSNQNSTLFKTTNGGTDWDPAWGTEVSQYLTYNFAQTPALELGDPKHVVVTIHEDCHGAYAPSCLAESYDAGGTWHVIKSATGGWEEAAGPVVLGHTTILLAAPGGFYYTADDGAHWEKLGNSAYPALYRADNGTLFLGSAGAVLRSTDGHTWTSTPGPTFNAVATDGTNLFVSFSYDTGGSPYHTAPLSDPTNWTTYPSPKMQGAGELAYDPTRHILYSATWDTGLWRVVTR